MTSALVLGGAAGAAVGSQQSSPRTVTTTAVSFTGAAASTVTSTQAVVQTDTVTAPAITKTVTVTAPVSVPTIATSQSTPPTPTLVGCQTPSDPANCVPPDDVYNPPSDFCDTHQCIGNFDNGTGYAEQCVDGMWSMSGGIQGACSDHGGESGYPQ